MRPRARASAARLGIEFGGVESGAVRVGGNTRS